MEETLVGYDLFWDRNISMHYDIYWGPPISAKRLPTQGIEPIQVHGGVDRAFSAKRSPTQGNEHR